MKKPYNLWKGRKIKIFSPDGKDCYGIGKYIGSVRLKDLLGLDQIWVPKFRLGRTIFYGWDCWWIPLSVAKKIEGKKKK